jgi:hypothetical protein
MPSEISRALENLALAGKIMIQNAPPHRGRKSIKRSGNFKEHQCDSFKNRTDRWRSLCLSFFVAGLLSWLRGGLAGAGAKKKSVFPTFLQAGKTLQVPCKLRRTTSVYP